MSNWHFKKADGLTDMTSPPTPPLTDLERDALAELSNIAMARAATSLRQMVESQVLLSVPSVDIVSKEDATRLIAKPNNPRLVAVRQDFKGPFSGRALLIFPEANSLELVRVVVGKNLPLEDISSLEDEALAETGNIILNSWVATIANLLKRTLRYLAAGRCPGRQPANVAKRRELRHLYCFFISSSKSDKKKFKATSHSSWTYHHLMF